MILMLSVFALCGYLLGSVPFGLVLCYLAGYGDIRKIGSGNIGATNVLRTGNKWLALLTVILDAFKAGIAAYIAYKLAPSFPLWGDNKGQPLLFNELASLIAGTAGILGHNFPIWLNFKGGKGVASSFGFILITCWPVAVIAFGVWLLMAFLFRYSSLAALTAAVAVPCAAFFMCPPAYAMFYGAIALLVIARHHANITRLWRGEESKITFRKKS